MSISRLDHLPPDLMSSVLFSLSKLSDAVVLKKSLTSLCLTSKKMNELINSEKVINNLLFLIAENRALPKTIIACQLNLPGTRRWLFNYAKDKGYNETYQKNPSNFEHINCKAGPPGEKNDLNMTAEVINQVRYILKRNHLGLDPISRDSGFKTSSAIVNGIIELLERLEKTPFSQRSEDIKKEVSLKQREDLPFKLYNLAEVLFLLGYSRPNYIGEKFPHKSIIIASDQLLIMKNYEGGELFQEPLYETIKNQRYSVPMVDMIELDMCIDFYPLFDFQLFKNGYRTAFERLRTNWTEGNPRFYFRNISQKEMSGFIYYFKKFKFSVFNECELILSFANALGIGSSVRSGQLIGEFKEGYYLGIEIAKHDRVVEKLNLELRLKAEGMELPSFQFEKNNIKEKMSKKQVSCLFG